jgi:hypothetical protein
MEKIPEGKPVTHNGVMWGRAPTCAPPATPGRTIWAKRHGALRIHGLYHPDVIFRDSGVLIRRAEPI